MNTYFLVTTIAKCNNPRVTVKLIFAFEKQIANDLQNDSWSCVENVGSQSSSQFAYLF